MLISSTFAWFTDSVTSGSNIIKSGELGIEMYWTDDPDSGVWYNVEDPNYNTVFSYEKWEPGYTDVRYVKIVNKGNLALNYSLTLTPQNEVGKLAEVINVYFANSEVEVKDRSDLSNLRAIGLLNNVLNGGATAEGTLLAPGQSSPLHPNGSEVVMTLAMSMITTAGNEYQEASTGDFTITALATQASFESDSFGNDYDTDAEYPTILTGSSATGAVTPVDGKVPTGGVSLTGGSVSAFVPAGVDLEDGTNKLTLTVTPLENTTSDITTVNNEILIPVDVHIDGVAEDNTVPIVIDLGEVLPKYLNMGNYRLFHVEDGTNHEMTLVADKAALTAHNRFTYDPLTGAVSVAMASFSEVALVMDTTNGWNGEFDDSWYDPDAAELTIVNADQFVTLGAIVGGMEFTVNEGKKQYNGDSFKGQTIKLLSDINLADNYDANNPKVILYPVGYYNTEYTYEKTGKDIDSGFKTFEGTFDGNGHTISNIYQNTWEMKGDHEWYAPEDQHYRDGMGLFGKVYGGTVKNLTVDNFESDGEITTTGVIAAYADCGATFENIAITNCNPRVYNIGNGGIVGCVGWYTKETTNEKVTFTNITVDNTNKISALWGSYDVACGGIVGQYYPTSGQTSVGSPKNAGIDFINCHVAAQIDVFNDVCGNYQYYAYRYAGMMIGSIRENLPADENGHIYPNMNGITAEDCTVHYETWNDYFYCELKANSKASYTHDHQFSRLEEVKAVNGKTITPLKGDAFTVPSSGRFNYVVVDGEYATENATCYHFVDGEIWDHASAGKETVGGAEIDVEDHRHIYLPFNQLFTGYGWGVTSKGISDFAGVEQMDITYRDNTKLVEKFAKNEALTGDFLYRVGNGNAFPIGKLFREVAGLSGKDGVIDSGVYVSVTSLVEGVTLKGAFVKNDSDWTQSTLHITGGTGPAKLTIQDYNHCKPFELIVEVVDGKNVTAYSDLKNANSVLLNDITMTSNGKYSLYDNKTLYGNGFTFNVEDGMDSDTTNGAVGNNGTVWVRNSTLDNVKIVGEVYTQYGGTAKSEYNFPTVLVLGDSVIANSYISNGCSPVRVGSGCNIEIINSTLEGGIFANLDIRGGTVKLQDVTTINQSTASGESISNDKKIVGLGIVVYDGAGITIHATNLKQYNCISEKATFTGEAVTLRNVIFGSDYTDYQFSSENVTWVNTGIVSMVAEVGADNIDEIDGYFGKAASIIGFNGYVYAPTGLTSVALPAGYSSSTQYQIAPKYSFDYTSKNNVPQVSGSNDYCYYDASTQKYLISFDDGENFTWDADILSITKGKATIVPSISVSDGATVNSDNTITFDTAGNYTVTYKYTDNDNYRLNSEGKVVKYSANYEKAVRITVYEVVDTSSKTEFAFGSNGFRTETANNLTYVMPNVNEVVAHPETSTGTGIGVTNIDGVDIYYPIVSMHKSASANWYNLFSVFEAVTITDLSGNVYNTSSTELPDGLAVLGGFILNENGSVTSTVAETNTTAIFDYSTGKDETYGTFNSYGLCYYPNSKFSSSTNDRAEQTIVAKYRYTDSNGTPYYYYVGYWCKEHTKQTCVTGDTLVTLADGTQKRVDALIGTEQLLVWDFYKGEYVSAPVGAIVNHGYGDVSKITMYFSDGTTIKVLGGHGFYDVSENKFAIIDQFNVKDYVGHEFIKCDDKLNNSKTVLVDYRIETVYDEVWTLVSAYHFDCILEGLLTLSPTDFKDSPAYLMPFEIGEDMKYDPAKMKADIEKYGLYEYEDFADHCTYEQFMGFAFANWKVAVGKGYINFEDIIYLIETYVN